MAGRHELHHVHTHLHRSHAAGVAYTPQEVAAAYNAPKTLNGSGVTVGIIELGGGYNSADLAKAGLTGGNVTVVGVDGGTSTSDGPDGADGEVMLDVEIVAAVAPAARIRVYFCPNTDAGFIAAVTQAAAECDTVSISWGGPEDQWDPAAVKAFSAVLADARKAGVPVFVAAGDSGSRDGERTNVVDYPAADPNAVGCGGTRLLLNADGSRASEVTWDDNDRTSATGGGVSKVFPGRQVPDVAGNADPATGYDIVVDGQWATIGGTSAVAPLYAALYALCRQSHGEAFDFLNTILTNPGVCFDVTAGDNGGYRAGPGRDNVTGWGVVDVGRLLAVLGSGNQIPTPGGGGPANPSGQTAAQLLTSLATQIATWEAANPG